LTEKANRHIIISPTSGALLALKMAWAIIIHAFSIYSLRKAISVLMKVNRRKKTLQGIKGIPRFFKIRKRYYYELYTPGFPSSAFDTFFKTELRKNIKGVPDPDSIQNVVLSITGKCPLNCEHCFEWERLSDEEFISTIELSAISRSLQEAGASIIQISGGEPLERFHDVCKLASESTGKTDFWLLSSGYGLDHMKAALLKHSGYTGVNIGLDHWDASFHNDFRGDATSFRWVQEASNNIVANGLVLALSLCARKEFISKRNLEKYLELARELNATFIQILEPRATGRYKTRDVALDADQVKLLGDFYLAVNNDKKYRNYPGITYHGRFQRSHGCLGAGNRFMYIDTRGFAHACPFCQDSLGNVLDEKFQAILRKMKKRGCHIYREYSGA